jgi:8-oxo-dGTP diphosphatase
VPRPHRLNVAAAVLRDAAGRVLIAQRGSGRSHAGEWEFPGGKLEPDETVAAAIVRELDEELGIEVLASHPLLTLAHRYPEREVVLHAVAIDAWRGTPTSREGQALSWVEPARLPEWPILAADRPILNLLRLPPLMAISPPDTDAATLRAGLDATLAAGIRLLQLRAPAQAPPEYRALARAAIERCRAAGASLLLNADPALALELGADGVHLNRARLAACAARPVPRSVWLSASVHDAAELERAIAVDADLLLVGPVCATASHPTAAPLGWDAAGALLRRAGRPCYALGGLGAGDLPRAVAQGAHGVAGISGVWRRA